ncbi:coiled-coil domain-containing protein 114 isoform X2 [Hypomesus transpacificus]|uniref:coiled-coil domain-containing protein 114 isoform X2 n=2 Tax=Hypomesus transpacificus TaxID=137520 RepID=UPI001F07AD50|nr:coiled-coil domain-containing protein 114 isoform X2 [Hypomesus transpacificus]
MCCSERARRVSPTKFPFIDVYQIGKTGSKTSGLTMPRGRSATSVHSDSSELDLDVIAETEMGKLHRQFRIMEGDRQAYNIQSQEHIRRQRYEIEKLEKEQEEMRLDLAVCESGSKRQQDTESALNLHSMLDQKDQVDDKLEREKQFQADLAKQIACLERKLTELRSGKVTQKSQPRQTPKATRTLEYRLDRALVRFNEQLTKNSHLRENLETLRLERGRFLQLQRRLSKELQEIRKEIGDMISLSTAAYDARVEAQSKMTVMKEKAVKDLAQYSAEMKELERVIAHERRLKQFMTTKCSERSGQDQGQDQGRRHEFKEQKRMDSREESIESLEEVFHTIQSVTGEENLDMLVSRFIQVEDKNFALFNYVNEQNNEVEALKDQIKQIHGEMEQYGVEELKQDREHQSLLRETDEHQKSSESEALGYEAQTSTVSKTLDHIKTGVNSLFQEMDCDRSVIEEMLGSSAGIRENNIMSYLSLVEQRTNEMLTIQAFLSSRDLERDYDPKDLARFLLGQNPEIPRQNVVIQPLLTGVDYDTEESLLTDEEERPLSKREIRQRILTGVLRKEDSVRPAGGRDTKGHRNRSLVP